MARDKPKLNFVDLPADRTWTSGLLIALDIPCVASRALKDSAANRGIPVEANEDEKASRHSVEKDQDANYQEVEKKSGEPEDDGDIEKAKLAWDECYGAFNRLMWPDDYDYGLTEAERRDETLPKRRKKARTWYMQAAVWDMLMSDRLEAIEKVMQSKGWLEEEDDEDEEDVKIKSDAMSPLQIGTFSTAKMDWIEFTTLNTSKMEPSCFAALLTEKPILATRAGTRWPRGEAPMTSSRSLDEEYRVERIRFLNTEVLKTLEEIIGSPMPGKNEAVLRPFKPLFLCYEELLRRHENSKSFATSAQKDCNDNTVKEQGPEGTFETTHSSSNHSVIVPGTVDKGPKRNNMEDARKEHDPDGASDSKADLLNDTVSHQIAEEDQVREANKEVTTHALLEMMQNELRAESKTHLECRNRTKRWIYFDDLWHLFFTGDLIYDPKLDQALRVLCVHNGRAILDSYFEATGTNASVAPQLVGSKTPFHIIAVGIDCDGESFGPVGMQYNIESWEGEQTITLLPVYPMEYARLAGDESDVLSFPNAKEASLRMRGQRFCDIVNNSKVAHREYRGFDIGKVREQIDSEVIVDVGFYYELIPAKSPTIGLGRPPPGEKREVIDNIHLLQSGKGSNAIYDDRELETERMLEFMRNNASGLLQKSRVGVELTADRQLLLPSGVCAYVLRTRNWHRLDVNLIRPPEQRQQSFEDLVLQPDYKRLVQGLVRTHSTGVKPTNDSAGTGKSDRREDLVRGKGKGVIILLHGVPGVGKSSTAECVAEYTKRPLLSVTCGDIGQTAEQVQWNLEQSLNLAHRWGCVMLLDEADVFLAARDKRDLQRNAIVSVFLRVLEYYSGILFLTTNKVGTFDEAFKSRIHLTLYYDKLDADQTRKIWEVNIARQKMLRPHLQIDKNEILRWSEQNYKQAWRDGTQIWNGRQIRNACQTAAALAEADEKGIMHIGHLEAVVKASTEFDRYLKRVHSGDDAERARRARDRADAYATSSREQYPHPEEDPRYADFYGARNYAYDRGYPPRQMPMSRGSRVYGDRDDRTPDTRMEPREPYEWRPDDPEREEKRYMPERHLSPSRGSAQFPRNPL